MSLEQEVHKIDKNVAVIQEQISAMEETLNKLVTRDEFVPVKLIAYGLATAVLTSVLMAILVKVLITK